MRVSVIGDRDEAFDEYSHVICLQQRGLGQVLLDSEMVVKERADEGGNKKYRGGKGYCFSR